MAVASGLLSASSVITSGHFIIDDKLQGNKDIRWDNLNNAPDPFWDNPGGDRAGCNIGFYVSGAATTCPSSPQPGGIDRVGFANNAGPKAQLDFVGASISQNVTAMNFAPGSTATFAITIMAELAGNHAFNELGVYVTDAGSSWGVAQTLIVLSGPDGPGVTKYFSPGGRNFGFYIKDAQDRFWYSGQTDTQAWQPFAVFRGNEGGHTGKKTKNWDTLWVGTEDGQAGDNDFNDIIFKVSTTLYPGGPAGSLTEVTPTPEPGPLFLIASGLLAFAHLSRRFRA